MRPIVPADHTQAQAPSSSASHERTDPAQAAGDGTFLSTCDTQARGRPGSGGEALEDYAAHGQVDPGRAGTGRRPPTPSGRYAIPTRRRVFGGAHGDSFAGSGPEDRDEGSRRRGAHAQVITCARLHAWRSFFPDVRGLRVDAARNTARVTPPELINRETRGASDQCRWRTDSEASSSSSGPHAGAPAALAESCR